MDNTKDSSYKDDDHGHRRQIQPRTADNGCDDRAPVKDQVLFQSAASRKPVSDEFAAIHCPADGQERSATSDSPLTPVHFRSSPERRPLQSHETQKPPQSQPNCSSMGTSWSTSQTQQAAQYRHAEYRPSQCNPGLESSSSVRRPCRQPPHKNDTGEHSSSNHSKANSEGSDAGSEDGSEEYESADEDDAGSEYSLDEAQPGQLRSMNKPFSKKNLKRHRLTHSETRFLLNEFGQNPHPDSTQRAMLARKIKGLSARQIQVWFQNRRAKLKRMSAADADRMLSTRSYPEGYGPEGFENRSGSGRDGPQKLPYVQPVEGIYASNGYEYQAAFSSGDLPAQKQQNNTNSQASHRNFVDSSTFASRTNQNIPVSPPHSNEAIPQMYDTVRATQTGPQVDASLPRSRYLRSPPAYDGSPVSSQGPITPMDNAYGRPLRSPVNFSFYNSVHRTEHYNEAQYPRSVPMEPGFIATTETSSFYLQPPYSALMSDRNSQDRASSQRYPAQLQRNHGVYTGTSARSPDLASPLAPGRQYEGQQQTCSENYGPSSSSTASHEGRSPIGDPRVTGYSDIRHTSNGHEQGRTQSAQMHSMQRAQQFYYGSPEQYRPGDEEMEAARRVYVEGQEQRMDLQQMSQNEDTSPIRERTQYFPEQVDRHGYPSHDRTMPRAEPDAIAGAAYT